MARKRVTDVKGELVDMRNWLVTVGVLAFMAFCVAVLAIAFNAGVI